MNYSNTECLVCELKRFPENQKTQNLKKFLTNLNIIIVEYSIEDYVEQAYNFYVNNILSTNPVRIKKGGFTPFKEISRQNICDHICGIRCNQSPAFSLLNDYNFCSNQLSFAKKQMNNFTELTKDTFLEEENREENLVTYRGLIENFSRISKEKRDIYRLFQKKV